ncbi:MAG: GrpB family protein [Candidatus Aenigmarchaeota archaeon]|nr:GrpB family protein [Candidatus Aenigmarchaeota archaeon]
MVYRVKIRNYDPKLPLYFSIEKKRLLKMLGKNARIIHIGSSSVPGLGGKNFIDILVLTNTKRDAVRLIKKIEKCGYVFDESSGDKFRCFFKRISKIENKKVRYHLHLMWKTSKKYQDYLILKEFLISHPEEAKKYFEIKKRLASITKDNREYGRLKSKYVEKLLRKAKKMIKRCRINC